MNLYSSEALKASLEFLNSTEKMVIEKRFGLIEGEFPNSLTRVAKYLVKSRERIRQTEEKALKSLRRPDILKT